MLSMNADLHCHSDVSDGTLSPEELALRAHQNGVDIWSLTDHDVIGGQARAQTAAHELGMRYIPGVEISVTWLGQTLHIVGLGFDPLHPILVSGLQTIRLGRNQRGQEIAEQLLQAGIPGAFAGARKHAVNPDLLSRTHFARYLVEQKICSSTDEVFKNFLVEGKPGYVDHVWATLAQSVEWILGAGGVAVIAHPGRYRLSDLQKNELYRQFKEAGGHGIEVITGSHTPKQYDEYAKVAKAFGFYASRGSDFHDPQESHIDLGKLPLLPSSLQPIWSLLH
jgi:predicted metal-dependent phosphoesterase TrpH